MREGVSNINEQNDYITTALIFSARGESAHYVGSRDVFSTDSHDNDNDIVLTDQEKDFVTDSFIISWVETIFFQMIIDLDVSVWNLNYADIPDHVRILMSNPGMADRIRKILYPTVLSEYNCLSNREKAYWRGRYALSGQ